MNEVAEQAEVNSPEQKADAPPPDVVPQAPRKRRKDGIPGFRGLGEAMFSIPAGILGLFGIGIALLMPPRGLGPSMCGLQQSFNIPCPGCGLTRSVSSFFHGQFNWSWHYHPLGFVFALAMIVAAINLFLPKKIRRRLGAWAGEREGRIGFVFLGFCVVLLLYGIFRIWMIKSGNPDFIWWEESGRTPPPWVNG